MQRDALTLLKSDNKDGWTVLKAAFGSEPIPEGYVEDVQAALCRTDFAGLAAEGSQEGSTLLLVASTFLGFVANGAVKTRFRQELLQMARKLRYDPKAEETITLSGRLMEAALNLSRCELTSSERVSEFAAIVADLASAWPRLGQAVLPIIQEMCDDLPIGQTAEMWRLNLRLRSQ